MFLVEIWFSRVNKQIKNRSIKGDFLFSEKMYPTVDDVRTKIWGVEGIYIPDLQWN